MMIRDGEEGKELSQDVNWNFDITSAQSESNGEFPLNSVFMSIIVSTIDSASMVSATHSV